MVLISVAASPKTIVAAAAKFAVTMWIAEHLRMKAKPTISRQKKWL